MVKLEMKSLSLFYIYLILLNITFVSTRHSGFDSLLKQYSSFKEKQLSRKAKNLLNTNSIKLTKDITENSRQLTENEIPETQEQTEPDNTEIEVNINQDENETESKTLNHL